MTEFVIHGHFYQPPRENPWTGAIDREPGAGPFHDWNEKIHRECYRPNAFARVLDEFGRIEHIVNNYEHISFNFGPTLISWIERHDPIAYQRILEADRASVQRRGRGNAIAQAYGHAILPLCNERDRKTQIRWGLADFRARFGRAAEALWLPETACDEATLGELIDAGMRYAILSPTQAERVRPDGAVAWKSVASGNIDPGVPYRWLHRDGSGRSLALFFYDGPIARGVAFEGALASSQALAARLARAHGGAGRLVHVATDGESYGHHFHFGDLSLAHALRVEAPAHSLVPTNYAAFLDRHPPRHEVEIRRGPDGRGTAWSCAHGVGRWKSDCGCHTGGREGWNQAWRAPLRAALDLLRDALAQGFEEAAADLLQDPWRARDDYVEVLLDPDARRAPWLATHARRALDEADAQRALALLEMQRHALLMYTSCGWFFADLSGIETQQVLRYAGCAIEGARALGLSAPLDAFLDVLAQAKSNLVEMGTGADIYRRFVEPSRVSAARVAAHVAILGLVGDGPDENAAPRLRVRCDQVRQEQHGRHRLGVAHLSLEERATGRRAEIAAAAMHLGGVDFHCATRPYASAASFAASAERLFAQFKTASLPALLRLVRDEFGPDECGVEALLPDGRRRVSQFVFGDLASQFVEHYDRLYTDHQRSMEMLQDAGFDLPRELRAAAEFALGRRFHEELRRVGDSSDPADYGPAIAIAQAAERRGFDIDRAAAAQHFGDRLAAAIEQAIADPGDRTFRTAMERARIIETLRLDSNRDRVQELLFAAADVVASWPEELRALAVRLGLSPLALRQPLAAQWGIPPGPPG